MSGRLIKYLSLTSVLLLGMMIPASTVHSQVARDSLSELNKIDIKEHLGKSIPLDLKFTDDEGNAVQLGDYFGKDKPVLLMLGYYECPMLCNLVLNGMSDAIKGLQWVPGDKYEVVSVSINHEETPELAAAKKANYIKNLDMPGAEKGWHFLTGEESQSKALAEAVGFEYYFVKDRDEFAHPAAIYVISPDGVISRYLYGIKYNPRDVKLALLEASEGKVGSTVDRIILYCYHYDPDAKGYALFAQNVMKVGGLLTLVVLSIFLGTLWIKDQLKPVQAKENKEEIMKAKV